MAQVMGTPSLDQTRNITGQGVGIRSYEQMHMIRLESKFNDLPRRFPRPLLEDHLQSLRNRPDQNLAPSLRTPNDMVDHQVNAVLLMFVVQVDNISYINTLCKHQGRCRLRATGLLSPA